MSRYINRIKVKDPNILTDKISAFLQEKGFVLGQRHAETVWWKKGFNCLHHIIIQYETNAVIVTAFITYSDLLLGGETEAGINGFVAGFGKWPLKKIVRALEKTLAAQIST